MKHIVVLVSVELGAFNAPAVHILSVARELAKLGNDITLIAPRPSGDMPVKALPENVTFDFTPDLTNWRLPYAFNSFAQLAALWRHRKKKLLYIRSASFSLLLVKAAQIFRYRAPVVECNGWLRDEVELIGYSKWLARLIGRFQVAEARAAGKVRVVTSGLRDLFLAESIQEEKIAVIGNGSNFEAFRLMDKQQCRTDLKIAADSRAVIFVGNLWPANDLATMFKALAILRQEEVNTRCLVVGDGISRAEFEREADKAGVADITLFTGMIHPTKVNLYLNAADVAVLPSDVRYYGKVGRSPLKLSDYTATGKTIVATSLPGIDDLTDEPWMFVVPPFDPEMMAEKMREALERVGKGTGLQARQYAERHFGWNNIAQRIADLFD